MSKATRVREAVIPKAPELQPETKNGDAPSPLEQVIKRMKDGIPCVVVELVQGAPSVSWLNGFDPAAAPFRLREAAQIVERHFGIRE